MGSILRTLFIRAVVGCRDAVILEHIKNIPFQSGFGKREPELARAVALCALARDKVFRLGYRRDMTHTAATFFWFFGYRKPLAVGGFCSI